ncbi:PE family protein [Tamaricihabitans halophyticus]|uniref:PE family protein n=1 Tax=Tamaricihabitans halophyticus TaxID=1262583 RepID=A0A4V2SSG4_9PSEU|nr:PE domain-containing protein [Tamaricihabitans halophyticus]TCP46786.1 PE family protein [Tamaricihabitans halophyticus]
MPEGDGSGLQNVWDTIGDFVDRVKDGFGQPGPVGGKYEYSEEQLVAIVAKLDELIDAISDSDEDVRTMTAILPPGEDPVSKRVAPEMNRNGEDYRRSLDEQVRYAWQLRAAYQGALNDYRGVESDNADTMRQASQSSDEEI